MTPVKYPRTFHLPWSEGATNDDRVLSDTSAFKEKHVIVTLKMDGENTSLYNGHLHARSTSSRNHQSRDWVKSFHACISNNIPEGWRICGENMWATHSIAYADLKSYFLGFSVWDENNTCLGWKDSLEWFYLLDITPVTEIFTGIFNKEEIQNAFVPYKEEHEGYVVRVSGSFPYEEFGTCVAKFVRANHVQTDEHWMHKAIVPNKLKG